MATATIVLGALEEGLFGPVIQGRIRPRMGRSRRDPSADIRTRSFSGTLRHQGSRGCRNRSGGGRWTRYLLGAGQLYAVDYHDELLALLSSTFSHENIVCIRNNGDDFPGVPEASVDFLFSFGTFVHLNIDIIDRYLHNMRTILKPGANAVIQYADKTKPLAVLDNNFSENSPERMRSLVLSQGFRIHEEDTKTLWHSAIIRFGP